eukprot:Selendium_serpulae@DN5544_c0_g1_i5.p1
MRFWKISRRSTRKFGVTTSMGLGSGAFFSFGTACSMKNMLDFFPDGNKVTKPKILGRTVWSDVPLEDLLPYIDWKPFFATYQLRGRFPNRDYPDIFKDPHVGPEAKKLFDEAQEFLKEIAEQKYLRAASVVGIWPANSIGEDIEVYHHEDDSQDMSQDEIRNRKPINVFHGMRQQLSQDDPERNTCQNLSDFIAPKESGHRDYIGGFACTAGIGCAEKVKEFEGRQEVDRSIMLEALADRLAEALAEYSHLKIRKELWGYAPNESLKPSELLACQYQGIRPALGYPTQPDHREKAILWDLINAEEVGIELSESFMMLPAASVSALVFAHPESSYFAVGHIAKDQVEQYSKRVGCHTTDTERWLSSILGYDR